MLHAGMEIRIEFFEIIFSFNLHYLKRTIIKSYKIGKITEWI